MIIISKKFLKFYFILIFSFIFISQIIIPIFNNGNDIFILGQWSLYSTPSYVVRDITWDDGVTYLFRDHTAEYKKKFVNLNGIYANTSQFNISWLKKNITDLRDFCQCKKVFLVELDGQISHHILFKKKLSIRKSIEL